MKTLLTLEILQSEAREFSHQESQHNEPSIYGITDGKAIGTYLEHKFQDILSTKYIYSRGSSAKGIDFPELGVDIKVTSKKQPQSSCPFKNARQKIYGLGYSIIVFVYDKHDNELQRSARLNIDHTIFIEKSRTGDYQTTTGLLNILNNNANRDDIIAFLQERLLPIDEIQADLISEEIIRNPPVIGYLTISNALQWRLQYGRVITEAGNIQGIIRIK